MIRRLFKGLFDHARYHHETRDMPRWVRRRIYRDLIDLIEEEHQAAELMGLPFPPRLCVVDEVRVAMLRPSDRVALQLDDEMQRARQDEVTERKRRSEARLRTQTDSS